MEYSPAYEEAKRLARDGSEPERAALAALTDTRPELLYFLAGDDAASVRKAVAGNAAAPAQADGLLAGDADPAVRARLGRKLAPRAAALAAAQDRLGRIGWEALCRLAEDAAIRVRAVLAEELKAMPDAPHGLILQLARDAAMEVAEPVIHLSPLLSEADLLALAEAPPVPETLSAIARRPALSEAISDALVASANEAAIGALLGNESAAIRESTLDGLILQAATRLPWQERLVRRPALSPRAQRALALCVAGHLLEPLAARSDLAPGLARRLQARLEARLAETPEGPSEARLFEAAGLEGDLPRMARLLATQATVPLRMVEQAARLRSAKALVSLCWQAGFDMRCALLAQTVLGQVPPGAALLPAEDGDWPLSSTEMLWQIELLADPLTA
ncbi:DUF2336 domain-containing protein [Belnapia sp. T6]|uniref:DUF2336 domain-containing protein n=1 Tax=Belnapia mucosa TaxID=2804532 RepID=A0ABS1V2C9_9PROT|nr:DUF2336 domain-containing protein [Belnapia mucosa]MBL6455853.1 DUF2336 domain-containing protein [Belnapia mucosa]